MRKRDNGRKLSHPRSYTRMYGRSLLLMIICPFLSTIGHNSDIADMGDFSDEDNEHWDEVETSKTYRRRYGRVALIVIAVHARS